MRTGIFFTVSSSDRKQLEAIVTNGNSPQKHVWRARIVLLSADCAGTQAIMAATGKSKTTVWRWQARYAAAGVAGLLSDATRQPGKAPTLQNHIDEVIRMTQENPESHSIDPFVLERLRWAISSVGHGAEEAVARTAIEVLERSLLLEFRGDEVSAAALLRGLREMLINE